MEQTYDDSLPNEPNMEETYENPLTYHEPNDQEEEEDKEDTLSLSDLPIYRDAADEEDLPTGELPSPRTLTERDLFEFSSGQVFATSLPTLDTPPQDPIIFCGKIIPYKKEEEEEQQQQPQPIHVYEDTGNVNKQRLRRRRWRICRWKGAVYLFSKSSSSSSSNSSSKGSMNSGKSGSTKLGLKDDGKTRRVSILATSGEKSRWYMIMFGFGSARFHQLTSEMKIRDLRKRQSSFMGSRSGSIGDGDDDDRKSSGGSCGCGRGMGLIRFLGCGGDEVDHHPNAIVNV